MTLDDVVSNKKPVEVESDEQSGDQRVLKKVITKRVKTLQDLIDVCEIDTSEWEIERWKCGAWQTGMKNPDTNKAFYSQQFVVMVWLKRKVVAVAAKNEIEELRKKAQAYSPKYPSFLFKPRTSSGNVEEVSIFDHHFGALIWGKETGGADYDSKIARDCWDKAFTTLISRNQSYQPDRILLILGNDQQNVDNRAGTTEKGTLQHSDGRYQKMFGVSRDASIWAIDAATTVAQFVDVVMVGGNHDPLATWHLGDSLASWFRRFKNINIDNTPKYRKYYEHGKNMLMFTHGNTKKKFEDYGRVMAAEQPDMWGRTRWRESHVGHQHHRELIEQPGATVRVLPSLRPPCTWSAENMYIGAIRAAESYVWNDQEGLVGTAVYSILDK